MSRPREPWNLTSWADVAPSLRIPPTLAHRIVIVPLPSRFNADVDTAIQMKHGVYLKAERIFHDMISRSNADAASSRYSALYFVPIYFGQLGNSRSSRLEEVDAAFASLQRVAPWPSLSRRFIFVVSVDRGRCFQDDAVDRFRDATVLMYEGTASYPRSPSKPQLSFPCYNRHTDIVIPPVTDLGARTRLAYSLPELNAVAHAAKHANASFPWSFFTHRKILAAWRGSATRTAWASKGGDDNNVDVRQALLHAFGKANHSTILAVRAARKDSSSSHLQHAPASQLPILISTRKLDKAQHYTELRKSLFCLAPSGWAQWTIRFFEAIHLGCIPVTFFPSPNPSPLAMPFESSLDYTTFSINVPPHQVANGLRPTLEAVATNRSRLRAMQRALWQHARPAFDYTDASERGPFYRAMAEVGKI